VIQQRAQRAGSESACCSGIESRHCKVGGIIMTILDWREKELAKLKSQTPEAKFRAFFQKSAKTLLGIELRKPDGEAILFWLRVVKGTDSQVAKDSAIYRVKRILRGAGVGPEGPMKDFYRIILKNKNFK
jgi:hypothetical protein